MVDKDIKDKHMGHLLLESFREKPDSICQIDASTGEEESKASVLRRSVQLARCLRRLGLVPGDVLALSCRSHLAQQYPYVAALFNGLPLVGIDPTYKADEVKSILKVTEPKIAFCEPESYQDYVRASSELGLAMKVYTIGTGEHSMQELTDTYQDDTPVEDFEVATFDADKMYVWLVPSGGTTGALKVAAITHNTLKYKLQAVILGFMKTAVRKDLPPQRCLHLSSIQWISGMYNLVSTPLLNQIKIQTSAPATPEHVIDIINKYKPTSAMFGPSLASAILRSEKPCDLSCLQSLAVTGGKVYPDVLLALRERVNKTTPVMEAYGQTENLGPAFIPNPRGPIGNCGRPYDGMQVKLVDPETNKEITEPNVTGELWTKGGCFSCYYNNPEETAAAFTEDGWFKTGDLLYHDADSNYYFVERLKMLIKYRNYHIMPPELEAVIRSHEAVADVTVTSVPDESDGEHAVACVVTHRGATVTPREIKELVASKLSETKHLRGGVVFLDQLPLTHSGKVARGKLRQLVINMPRE